MAIEKTQSSYPSYAEAAGEGHEAYTFYCPGCKHNHIYYVRWGARHVQQGPTWSFNGDMEKPTFSPSLLNTTTMTDPERPDKICHLFLTDGMLQFLSDCTHELAGKTVPV